MPTHGRLCCAMSLEAACSHLKCRKFTVVSHLSLVAHYMLVLAATQTWYIVTLQWQQQVSTACVKRTRWYDTVRPLKCSYLLQVATLEGGAKKPTIIAYCGLHQTVSLISRQGLCVFYVFFKVLMQFIIQMGITACASRPSLLDGMSHLLHTKRHRSGCVTRDPSCA